MKYFIWLLRIVVGVLFIFSGLIKANDPLGLSYKMNEFFEVMHLTFMIPYSLSFSVLMIAAEIILGVTLLLGYAYRLTSVLLLLLILLFTYLTAFALYSGKIKECGCFGDCIKLTPTQTFYKDVALLVMIIILLIGRRFVRPLFSKKLNLALVVVTVVLSFFIQWRMLEHLPYIDCLPYKTGNNLWEKMQPPPGSTPSVYETVLVYEKDGVKKEFTQQQYASDPAIWGDTTMKYIETRTKLIRQGNDDPAIKDFSITDYDGNNYTEQILKANGPVFLFFVKDPAHAHKDNLDRIARLFDAAEAFEMPTYLLFSCGKEEAQAFQKKWGLEKFPAYVVDATASKTAMRSNPGLMMLQNGSVAGKWSFKDYPATIRQEGGQIKF